MKSNHFLITPCENGYIVEYDARESKPGESRPDVQLNPTAADYDAEQARAVFAQAIGYQSPAHRRQRVFLCLSDLCEFLAEHFGESIEGAELPKPEQPR